MYQFKSMVLLAALAGLIALVGFFFFGWFGVLVALGIGLAANGFSRQQAAALLLRLHRARPLDPWRAPRLFRLARYLAERNQMPLPQMMLYPAQVPNAFALGLGAERGVVAVSDALLQLLDEREMAGVLAHEFAHIKNRDSTLSLTAGIFVQVIGVLSQGVALVLLLLLLSGSLGDLAAGLLPMVLLVGGAPLVATLLQAGLMRTRERLADRDAVRLTNDPGGLASALQKLQAYSNYLSGLMRRFRFIYTAPDQGGVALLRTHPSTQERVQTLLNMEREHIGWRLAG